MIIMKKVTKRRVFISKIRETKVKDEHYFWYQVGTGSIRTLRKGTIKRMEIAREEVIEKYKSEYIKLGA